MLQNITLLNSVQNNAGLGLGVAQGAEHRVDLRVEASARGTCGKHPCDGASGRAETGCAETVDAASGPQSDALRAQAVSADSPVDVVAQRISVAAAFAVYTADATFAADAAPTARTHGPAQGGQSALPEGQGSSGAETPRRTYRPERRKPIPASMRRSSNLPAAIWAALVLSRV